MKKIVRLTESELKNIVEKSVRRAIKEGAVNEYGLKDFGRDAAFAGGLGLAGAGTLAGNAYLHGEDPEIDPQQQEINQAVTDEFGSPQGKLPNDTINFDDARRDPRLNGYHVDSSISNKLESRIRGAVMESLIGLMRECGGTDKLADRKKAFGKLAHLDIDTKNKDDQKEALKMRKGYIKNQRKA
jgi:hypothetical protein